MVSEARAQERQIFTVDADAIVRIPPDRVVISAGARTKGKALGEVRQKNRIIINNAVETAQRCGVLSRNIGIGHLRIDPKFDGETERIEWYCVEQRLTTILDDISRYEELLSRLIDSGINEIHDVEFMVADLKKYRNNARVAAIAAAVEKANFLAHAAGLTLGGIVNLSERSSWYSPFGKPNGRERRRQLPAQTPGGSYSSDESGNEGVLGMSTISIQAFVTVRFELMSQTGQRAGAHSFKTRTPHVLDDPIDLPNLPIDHLTLSASVRDR